LINTVSTERRALKQRTIHYYIHSLSFREPAVVKN